MPDTRSHRGKAPDDDALFGPEAIIRLRAAAADYSLLLTKGYAECSSLKLVGDHFGLTARQRTAAARCSCDNQRLAARLARQIRPPCIRHQPVLVDGYNILITLEAALSGAYLFEGCDGCIRDLSGIHGTYRRVHETPLAIDILCRTLSGLEPSGVVVYLDRPVSNSARLKTTLQRHFSQQGLLWQAELADNPDKILSQTEQIVISSDSDILDHCGAWVNLTAYMLQEAAELKSIVHLVNLK